MRPGFHRFLIGTNNKLGRLPSESAHYSDEWDCDSIDDGDLDQAPSIKRPVEKAAYKNDEENFSLLDFPIEILARILSFVDKETLFSKCSLVCSRLYRLLKSRSFWAAELERTFSASELAWITSLSPDVFIDYGRLVVCQPFRRNLIRNCCGEHRSSKYWTVTTIGDYQLAVEINKSSTVAPGIGMRMTMAEMAAVPRPSWLDLPGKNCCFATSFAIFDMEQFVDFFLNGCQTEILDILRPPIAVGEWMASRIDSELVYRLEVFLFDANGVELARYFCENRLDHGLGGQWVPVSYVFENYPSGVRRLLFRHSAVDPSLSCEHFGAKFAGATVKLLIPPKTSHLALNE